VSQPAKSYERVHYEFRPAKQVERRMMIHAFHHLMTCGFAINNYRYTGLGSIYFIDFIMFHRYLGIKRFLSVEESSNVAKRIDFNKPFACVNVAVGDVIEHIPHLSPDIQHILWLDYDHLLTGDVLDAVCMASIQLSPASIFIVTVDAEPPGCPQDGPTKWNPNVWRDYFVQEAEQYLWAKSTVADFAREKLLQVNARLIDCAISKALVARPEVMFLPLFNFTYADGHRMLSLGGMIGTKEHERQLKSLDYKTLCFLRKSLTGRPYEIIVPKVTRKERLYLDHEMPCEDNWTPTDFELSSSEVAAYRRIYQYYPAYTEMLL
jgi:hypothetical protein